MRRPMGASALPLTDIDDTVELAQKAESRPVRFDIPCRRCGTLERRASHAIQLARADYHAGCGLDGDAIDRNDRHGLHNLQGAL